MDDLILLPFEGQDTTAVTLMRTSLAAG